MRLMMRRSQLKKRKRLLIKIKTMMIKLRLLLTHQMLRRRKLSAERKKTGRSLRIE